MLLSKLEDVNVNEDGINWCSWSETGSREMSWDELKVRQNVLRQKVLESNQSRLFLWQKKSLHGNGWRVQWRHEKMEQTPQVEHSINKLSFIESQSVRMYGRLTHITVVCKHVHVQIESSHYQNMISFFGIEWCTCKIWSSLIQWIRTRGFYLQNAVCQIDTNIGRRVCLTSVGFNQACPMSTHYISLRHF